MLGYLLARAGVDVVVLEKHADFLRDFRGDTIHPSTIDLLGELGLKDEFLMLPHDRIETLDVVISGNRIRPIDFRRLRDGTRFLALMPQWDFLNFMADQASQFPNFRLIMQAEVTGIRRSKTHVAGITATTPDGPSPPMVGPPRCARPPAWCRASSASPWMCSGSTCPRSAVRSRRRWRISTAGPW